MRYLIIFISLFLLFFISSYIFPKTSSPSEVNAQSTFSFNKNYVDTQYGGNGKPGWVKAGDMDNDGDLDLVGGGGRALFIYENDGNPNQNNWTRYGNLDSTGSIGANGGVLFDVDNDGDLDVVSAKYYSELGWWENPGGPLTTTSWAFYAFDTSITRYLHDMIKVDINQDGIAEEIIAVLNSGYWDSNTTINWYLPTSQGASWQKHNVVSAKPGPANNHAGVDIGDIDKDGDLDIAFSDGWIESSSTDGTGVWTWRDVTNIYGVSNNLARDVDNDGDLDLVMSAGHHGQGVYWFENDGTPVNGGWIRHDISPTVGNITARHYYGGTENGSTHLHHPECLQAEDLDFDNDLDVFSCELFFGEDAGEPGWGEEKHNLVVFENQGNGSWNQQNIAPNSYPSHKLQLADINQDGLKDIISQGAGFSVISYYQNTTSTPPTPSPTSSPSPTPPPNWWNSNWDYRIPVNIDMGNYERVDKPAEVRINFTNTLSTLGKTGAFSEDSLRVVEVDGSGNVVNENVVFQFDKDGSFDASTNASGTLVFLLSGPTPANSTRYFHIYFDVVGKSFTPPSITSQISLTDGIQYEGEESYKIDTQNATYYYHKAGAGFASMIDANGNDWISYRPGGGSSGEYRGIPNAPDFGHPGNGFQYNGQYAGTSTIINQGPIKLTIKSTRLDNAAELLWEVYPNYVKNTVVKMPGTYIWGYEGTPGGAIEAASDSRTYSDGATTTLNSSSNTDLPNPEWIYFSDPATTQKIFLVNHQNENFIDQYWTMNNEMTVFGFGREGSGAANYKLNTFPGYFTFGFADAANYPDVAKLIESSYRDMIVTTASPESKDGGPPPSGIAGDINGDGIVNILDYTLLSNAFGTSDPVSDINGDGTVNILDYTILSNNFGSTGAPPTPTPTPTQNATIKIEAEDYKTGGEGIGYHDTTAGNSGNAYKSEDVDIQTTSDTGGGYNVGWTVTSEWLAYDVNINQTGSYNVTLRVASANSGAKTLRLTDSSGYTLATLSLADSTGGWQSWVDISANNVNLTSGQQELRIFWDSNDVNLNYLEIN